ncbi:MAG: hypothetical protein JXR84_05420, partial [Anaerolineae bacterium]|nr:hypothetical protein [Anaerolineae bacterium]
GNPRWEPDDTGPFVVLAWVDTPEGGTGRVDESDENNNMQTNYDYVRLFKPVPTDTPTPRATPTLAPTATPQPIVEKAAATAAPETLETPEPSSPSRTVALISGAGALVVIIALVGIALRRRRG